MESITRNLLALLLVMSSLSSALSVKNSQKKDELIQDTVRKFLGVKSEDRSHGSGKVPNHPPRYMMDLYERYRSGQTPMQGNTVRSILATRDAGADMLIFNLTGLKTSEQILQSKFYLLKRPKRKNIKKKDHSSFRLNLGCLPNMTSLQHINIELDGQKPDWQSYDISESVVSCRQTRKPQDSLLGLTLEVERSKGRYRHVSFKRIMKKNSQPFVLIFSEDSQNQTNIGANTKHEGYDEIRDLLRMKANEESFRPPKHKGKRASDDSDQTYVTNYLKASTEYFNSGNLATPCDLMDTLRTAIDGVRHDLKVEKHRKYVHEFLRSVDLPQQSVESQTHKDSDFNSFHNSSNNVTAKKVLQSVEEQDFHVQRTSGIRRQKRNLADTLRYSTNEMESHEVKATVKTVQVISEKSEQGADSLSKTHRKKKKEKTHKNRRRKKKKNRKIPFWWTKHDSGLHEADKKLMCRRKGLTVDFSQIGWDDWIISPKSFNAHYCEGSCTFPIIKYTDNSNHAAVQSLVRAMQVNTEIPIPSCVPSATSPLTLLYFDEHGNLVLKSYPNMIVKKCGCR